MEDGGKEELPEKPKCALTADKAGWVKKSSGGILGFWKERYVLLCKSQLLMFEDEDEQKCVEMVELENYERCQDLRALLNRKHRFILIRSPGYKVQDIKFQACHKEEKESWMKALNEGISRGKNRVFDEVKVDEGFSLEHVTRGRAKVGQGRRPPTRSHLKEVANSMSDGFLRLDLDVPDSAPPSIVSGTGDAVNVPPRKEVVKPLMPPAKPLSENQNLDSVPEDLEVKTPLMPPAKNVEETEIDRNGDHLCPEEGDRGVQDENTEESKAGPELETSVEGRNAPKVPVPPPKVLSSMMKVTWDNPASDLPVVGDGPLPPAGSKENLSEEAPAKPPTPPPKILSAKLRASMSSPRGSSEVVVPEDDQRSDGSKPRLNGINGEGATGPTSEEPVFEPKEGRRESSRTVQENVQEQGENSSAPEANKERSGLLSKSQGPWSEPASNPSSPKPRSSSVGDLLGEPKKKAFLGQGVASHLARMENEVASERERTEKLLQEVLSEGPLEGNGPPTDRETLLKEATEQLRQATQVLQEVRVLEELKKEPVEKHKGVSKDLVTLYRRSAP